MAINGDRLVLLGGALAGLSGAAAIAYWIYVLESTAKDSFWSPPGFISVSVCGLALVILIGGLFTPGSTRPNVRQRQTSGPNSINVQSGNDITFNSRDGNSDGKE